MHIFPHRPVAAVPQGSRGGNCPELHKRDFWGERKIIRELMTKTLSFTNWVCHHQHHTCAVLPRSLWRLFLPVLYWGSHSGPDQKNKKSAYRTLS